MCEVNLILCSHSAQQKKNEKKMGKILHLPIFNYENIAFLL